MRPSTTTIPHPDPLPIGERKRPRLRRIRRVLTTIAIFTTLAFLAFHGAVRWWPYPDDVERPMPPATLVLDRNGIELAAFAAPDGQWRLPLDEHEINPHLRDAVIAVEDARFFDHAGVDWVSATAAAWQNFTSMRVRRGASTITMQVHRMRDPRPRSLGAKLEQAVRAEQIEQSSTKRKILLEYLNRIPLGGNLVGAGAASWKYFGKPCTSLSLAESALLAGLAKNPNRFRPDRFPDVALARRNVVLGRMLELGMISRDEHAHACAEAIVATWRPLPQTPDDHAALPALLDLTSSGSSGTGRITTTLDAATQQQACAAGREQLAKLAPMGVTAAAVVVLDSPTGETLASVSLSTNDVNRIDLTRRPRSSGSVLKPLIYAAAFEAGVTSPAAVIDDSPTAWPGYEPRDYDREFRGNMTAAEALRESRNIPAMLVLARTGVAHVRGVMESAGLQTLGRSPRAYGVSLAVGGADATPMEVARAYAGLARGGTSARSQSPVRGGEDQGEGPNVETRHSALSPSPLPSPPSAGEREKRFLASRACWQTLAALSDQNRTASLSRDAARLNIAWKTGTSSGHRDAWCAAVTPRRTVVVWLGNAAGGPSHALVGRDAAAPLALNLIAALDAVPAVWPVEESTSPVTVVAATPPPSRARLAIVSPAPKQEILLSGDVPADHQRISLRSAGDPTSGAVHWFIDGEHLGVANSHSDSLWWTPKPGSHEIRAVDATGDAAVTTVSVRPG